MTFTWHIPYEGSFRDLFPETEWLFVSQIFREAFAGQPMVTNPTDRQQAKSLADVLKRVHKDALERLQRDWEAHKPTLRIVLANMAESKPLCAFLRQTEYRQPATLVTAGYDQNRPTEPQLHYLRKMGVRQVPKTKNEASRLIGEAKRRAMGQTSKTKAKGALYV